MKIKLEMNEKQAAVLSRALETLARIGMFQFDMMLELFNPMVSWDDKNLITKYLKSAIPSANNHSQGITNIETPEECQIAWDAYQHIRRELAWASVGKNWRKDTRTWGSSMAKDNMIGVHFDEPMKCSRIERDFKTERIDDVEKREGTPNGNALRQEDDGNVSRREEENEW